MFSFMADRFIPTMLNRIFETNMGGFLSITNPEAIYPTLIVYAIWCGFGVPIVMYVGAMAGIDPSCIEAAQIDGVTPMKEFVYVVLPQVFPTVSIYISTGVAILFIDQLNLFTFYHVAALDEYQTMGYYMYVKVLKSTGYADYPYCAAIGILLTVTTLIILTIVRKILNKIDPMKEAV
jgi:ABC-type sugar transport system permease subunit